MQDARSGFTTGLPSNYKSPRRDTLKGRIAGSAPIGGIVRCGRCFTAVSIRAAGARRGARTTPAFTRSIGTQPTCWRCRSAYCCSSAADAFLTGILLVHGADEVNPIMAVLVYRNVAVFAALKMAMTGVGIVVMVFLARYRFMRVIRVDLVLYAVLLVYAWLIGYEISMLPERGRSADLVNSPDGSYIPYCAAFG